VLDVGTIPELAVFGGVFAALTWAFERPLLAELIAYARERGTGHDPAGASAAA